MYIIIIDNENVKRTRKLQFIPYAWLEGCWNTNPTLCKSQGWVWPQIRAELIINNESFV